MARSLLHSLLKRKPKERPTATAAAKQCQHWSEAAELEPKPTGDADHVECIAEIGQIPEILHERINSADDIKESLALAHERRVSKVQSSVPNSHVTADLGADFAIFDDMGQASEHILGRCKGQPEEKQLRNNRCSAVKTSRRYGRQPFGATGQHCKENLGPGAPPVCKHAQVYPSMEKETKRRLQHMR